LYLLRCEIPLLSGEPKSKCFETSSGFKDCEWLFEYLCSEVNFYFSQKIIRVLKKSSTFDIQFA
jgi:hypothetical protein